MYAKTQVGILTWVNKIKYTEDKKLDQSTLFCAYSPFF